MPHRNTVCLVVIFRNEEDFLEDLIESVNGYIDYAIFLDSDSDDESVHIINTLMSGTGIKWEIHNFNEPFRGDTKRTRALQLAYDKAEYLLLMDADNTLEVTDGQLVENMITPFYDLDQDAYYIDNVMDVYRYPTVHLLRGDLNWYYEGIIHEYPTTGSNFSTVQLTGVQIHEPAKSSGPRARDLPTYYYDHALILEREMFDNRDTLPGHLFTRYTFYCAQSYKDAGKLDRAIEMYRARSLQGGFDEEIFYSLLQIAIMLNNQGRPIGEIITAALLAWLNRPQRKEAAHFLMELLIFQGRQLEALRVGEISEHMPCTDKLFIQENVYTEHFPRTMQQLRAHFKIDNLEIVK